MIEIKLYHRFNRHNLCAIIDDCDYDIVKGYTWSLKKGRIGMYASTPIRTKDFKTNILMHRLILGAKKGEWVDHLNWNGLDNRRANIRIVAPGQNNQNRRKILGTSSSYTGVCWDKSKKKWASIIQYNKKTYNLGRFHSEVEAALAYDAAAIKFYGQYAKLNFPHKDSLRDWSDFTAVSNRKGQSPLNSARPSFERHAFGLLAQVRVSGACGTTEAAEMSGGSIHTHQGDKQAVVVALDGNIQGLHRATIQGPISIARDR